MPPYAYNDLRNPSWYSRLQGQINEDSMRRIQATGSEADDPYWAAKRNRAMTDLNSARTDAMRGSMETWALNQRAMQEREKARQRTISAALARDWRPDQLLGTQSADIPQNGLISGGEAAETYPAIPPAPEAYARPYSSPPAGLISASERSAGAYRPYKSPAPAAPKPVNTAPLGTYRPSGYSDRSSQDAQRRADAVIQRIAESLYKNDFYARYRAESKPSDYYAQAVKIYAQSGGRI